MKNLLPLAIVLIIAFFLRFYQLSSIPIGLNDDEAAFGYNAFAIKTTGHDEWGKTLPFPAFESFGDWKLVGYLYPTVISQAAFGSNEFATRLPSATFGLIAIVATYLLAKKLFNREAGLLAALFLAISPWHIVASRNAFESDILIVFITTGTWLFLESLKNPKLIKFSTLIFALSLYVYRSSWLFVPLFLLALIFFYKEELKKNRVLNPKYAVLFLISILPLLPTASTFSGQSRFFQESFVTGIAKVGIINEINEKRGECQKFAPNIACQFVYNKYTSYITAFTNNYFENLSPGTYFTKGIANGYQSFSDRGLFYSFEFPLLVAGVIGMLIQKNPNLKLLLAWILIAPIGASLTGIGNPGRLNIIMPAPQMFEAAGLLYLISYIKTFNFARVAYFIFAIIVILSVAKLTTDMFFHYPQISGRSQRYGYKELFTYLEGERTNYSQIIVSNQRDSAKQYIHYLFYNQISPNVLTDAGQTKRYRDQGGWQVVEQIRNVRFLQKTPTLDQLPDSSLLALSEKEKDLKTVPVYTVFYKNGDKFFEIYGTDQVKSNNTDKNDL